MNCDSCAYEVPPELVKIRSSTTNLQSARWMSWTSAFSRHARAQAWPRKAHIISRRPLFSKDRCHLLASGIHPTRLVMSAFTAQHRATSFGSIQPWAEPAWYDDGSNVAFFVANVDRHTRPSPYYDESHFKLRNAVRKWVADVRFFLSKSLARRD